MKRAFDPAQPELMDLPQPVTDELRQDLTNLAGLNRHFGSHRIIRRHLAQWLTARQPWRILDVATGAGDIPGLMVAWARPRGIAVEIDAIDASPATLAIAQEQGAAFPEIRWHHADALTFTSAEPYDLVHCSLALHHFSEPDAITLLRRFRELSRKFVLVTDLTRSLGTTLGVWLVTALLYRDPMTRYDGRLSARRAFSFSEMRALAESAGWRDFTHRRHLFCRQSLALMAGVSETRG